MTLNPWGQTSFLNQKVFQISKDSSTVFDKQGNYFFYKRKYFWGKMDMSKVTFTYSSKNLNFFALRFCKEYYRAEQTG